MIGYRGPDDWGRASAGPEEGERLSRVRRESIEH